MTIDDFVKTRVADQFVQVGGDKEAVFNPSDILLWLSVAKEVLAMLQECRKLRDPADIVKRPNLKDRLVLRNEIRKNLGVRGFRRDGRPLIDAFLKAGGELTKEEVESLCEEV